MADHTAEVTSASVDTASASSMQATAATPPSDGPRATSPTSAGSARGATLLFSDPASRPEATAALFDEQDADHDGWIVWDAGVQAVLHTELQVCYTDVDAFFALLAPTSDGRISRTAFTAAANSLTWPQFTKLVLHLRHSQRPRPASRDARKILSLLALPAGPRSPDDASMPVADAAAASPATTPLRARARSYNLLTAARAAASAVVTRAGRLRSATVTARPSVSSLPTAMPLSSRTTATVASMTAELVRMAADAQRELAALDASLHAAAGASTDSLATAASTVAVGEDTGAEPAVPPTAQKQLEQQLTVSQENYIRLKRVCYETQEALFTAMVNCEQLAEDLEATTAELAEHQSRWRSEEQAHRDQLHALRATVEEQDAMITTLQQPAAAGDDKGSSIFDVPVVSASAFERVSAELDETREELMRLHAVLAGKDAATATTRAAPASGRPRSASTVLPRSPAMVAQAPPLVRSGLSTSMPVLNAEPPPVPRKDSELRADAALRARCADLEQRIAQYQRALRLKETETDMAEMTTLDSATITAATQAELQQRMFVLLEENRSYKTYMDTLLGKIVGRVDLLWLLGLDQNCSHIA